MTTPSALPILLFCCSLLLPLTSRAQVVINEFSAANFSQFTDNLGQYEDWIELYNSGNSSVNVGGYYLSDRLDTPLKYQIPAGVTIAANDHLRVWASGNDTYTGGVIHTNFQITQTRPAETIVLSNNLGMPIDSHLIVIPNKKHHSWGRTTDGGPTWGVLLTPTPNNTNTNVKNPYATRPVLFPLAGFYTGSVEVSITTPDANVTLRYTTDGSTPTNTSTIYNGPFTIAVTTVVKAIAISSNNNTPDSHVDVHTYFIDETHSIPVVSVSGSGLPTLLGGNGGAMPEGYFEYFDATGDRVSDSSGEFNKHGNDSWAYAQRGFDYIARDQFGDDYAIKHKIFPNKDRNDFQRVILKAAANDNYPFAGGAHIRDSYVHELSQRANMELDERSHQSCIVYLNGEYRGVYDLREKVDDHDFTKHYYNQGREWIDFIKTWGSTWAEYGSRTDWDVLHNFILSNDMTNGANYAYVESQLEVLSLIDYIIINTHTVCKDWLNWNTAWWRGRKPDGSAKKWRYALWDMDATFGHYVNYTGVPDVSPYADPCDIEEIETDFEGHTDLLIKLMENEEFFALYINRYADLNNTFLSCDYMIELLDEMVATITPEMPGQIARWGGNYNTWLNEVQQVRDFILTRCVIIDDGIIDCYDVTGPYDVIVDVDPPLSGAVQINTVIGDNYPWSVAYFGGVPVTLTAIENPGFVFSHWTNTNNTLSPNNNSITVSTEFANSGTITAHFIQSCQLEALVEGPAALCEGESGSLSVSTEFDSYLWSTNASTSSIDISAPGTYSVTVSYGISCTSETSFEVAEVLSPTLSISGNTVFCANENTLLDAGPGYSTYLWSDASSNQQLEVSSPGSYQVTVTNGAGCSAAAAITVSETPPPVPIIAGDLVFCNNATTNLSLLQNYIAYLWSDNSTTPNLTVTSAGDYAVTVTDAAGCTGETMVSVSENTALAPNILGVSIFCEGSSSTLSLSQNYQSYLWSDNSTSPNLNVTEAGVYTVIVTDDAGCTGEAEIEITISPQIDAQIIGATSFCEGSSSTLSLSQNYANYLWSDNSTATNLNVTEAGIYTVIVTDDAGCTGEAEIEVSISDQIDAQIIGATSFCEGSSSTLSLSQNYQSYLWSDNSTSTNLNVTEAGVYTVIVTDDSGCTGEAEIEVSISDQIDAQIIGVTSFCEGSSSLLSLSQNYANYLWSDNSTTPNLDVTDAGVYTVIVTDDAGCTGEAEIEVSISDQIDAQIIGATSFCEGSSSILSLSQNYQSYLWSDNSTTPNLEVIDAGVYTVIVTDDAGCTGEAEIEVTISDQIDAQIIGATSFCEGSSSTLSLSQNYQSYLWSDNSTTPNLEVTEAGVYTVIVTDDAGCTGEAEIEVSISDQIDAQIIGATSFCEGSSSTLSLSQNYQSYLWSDNSTTPNLDVTDAGVYTVIVTDDAGCTGEAEIEVSISDQIDAQIIGATSFCEGSSSTLSLSQNYQSYLWSDNSTTPNLDVTDAGVYTVIVTDDAGCTGEAEIEVSISDQIDAQIIGATSFCEGSSSTLSLSQNYANYLWSDNSTATNLNVTEAGVYTVIVTDDSGCTGEAEIEVIISDQIDAQIIGATSFCEGSSSTLSLSQNYQSYLWSDNSTATNLNVTEAGVYTVIVTDDSGCTGEAEIEVSISDQIDAQIIGATSFCEGSSSTLSLSQNYQSYLWSDNSTATNLNVTEAGVYSVIVTDDSGCTGDAEIEVSISDQIDPLIIGATSFCEGSSSTLSLSQNYQSYLWSDNSTATNLNVTEAGVYSVIVTDDSGCTGDAEIEVSISDQIDPLIIGATSFCEGSSSTLSLSQNYQSYLWSDNSTTPNLEVTDAGIYTVIVTDDSGCTGDAEIEVTISPQIDAQIIGATSFCEGSSSLLSLSQNYANYLWSDNSTSPNLDVTEAGVYTVIVTDDAGCTGEAEIEVSISDQIDAQIIGATSFCEGSSSTLSLSQNYANYLWSDNSTATNLNVTEAGVYTVIVTDDSGCTGEAEIEVTISPQIDAQIIGATSLCEGSSSTLSLSQNYQSFLWSDNSTSPNLDVTDAGVYYVIVTDDSGCTGEAEIEVSISDQIDAQIIGATSFCEGSSSTLSLSQNYQSYLWSDNSTTPNLDVTDAGIYTVIVTDDAGCTGEAEIEVSISDQIDAQIIGATSFCEGSSSTLSLSQNYQNYLWSDNSTSPNLDVTDAGIYTVIVTDDAGCTGDAEIEVSISPQIDAQIIGATSFCEGSSSLLSLSQNYANYLWSDNSTSPNLDVTDAGIYTVIVTDDSGCTGEAEIEVAINQIAIPQIVGLLSFCEGEGTALSVAEIYATYQWSSGGTTSELAVVAPGDYQVTVSEASGCTAVAQVSVTTLAIPESTEQVQLCNGESWAVGNSVYSLSGNYTDVLESTSGCDSIVHTLLEIDALIETEESVTLCYGGLYQGNSYTTDASIESLYNSTSGCDSIHMVELNVLPQLSASAQANSNCGTEGSAWVSTFGGAGNYNFLWNNGATGSIIEELSAGTYMVTVTDSQGCSTTATTLVVESIGVAFEMEVIPVSCHGESDAVVTTTILSGTAPFSYTWSNGANAAELSGVPAGMYTLLVEDANDCLFGSTVVVAEPAPLVVDPVTTGTTATDGTATALAFGGTGPYTYLWAGGQTSATIGGLGIGIYSVTVTDAHGCTAVGEAVVSLPTRVEDVAGVLSFLVGPNPGEGLFFWGLELVEVMEVKYKVYGMDGKVLLEKELGKGNGYEGEIDLRGVDAGVYILVLDVGGAQMVWKLVVV